MLEDAWHSPDHTLKGTHFKSVANIHKNMTELQHPPFHPPSYPMYIVEMPRGWELHLHSVVYEHID